MSSRAAALAVLLAGLSAAGCSDVRSLWPFGSQRSPSRRIVRTKPRTGTLLLAGGGPIPGAVVAEAARVAGQVGEPPRVIIVPLGARTPESGRGAAATWTRAGFADVELLDPADAGHAAAQLDGATFIWLTGADENRVAARLLDEDLTAGLRSRFDAGALVGGTGVGAAAVAELFLAGGEEIGRPQTVGGLGLWTGVIVDDHFAARARFARLTAAVLDRPQFIGVGIDDGAGVLVEGDRMKALGVGNVMVIDARRAHVGPSRGDLPAASGVEVQILTEGMTYELR